MAKTLEQRGFRFVYAGSGLWMWVHPDLKKPQDVDCTDMTDEEFDRFVGERSAADCSGMETPTAE